MSFPPATEMFQFAGFASRAYGLSAGSSPRGGGCPIRRSPDQRLLAASRGLSQRATSFIASRRQGIHQMPFVHSRTHHPAPAARPEGQKRGGQRAKGGPRRFRRIPISAVRHPTSAAPTSGRDGQHTHAERPGCRHPERPRSPARHHTMSDHRSPARTPTRPDAPDLPPRSLATAACGRRAGFPRGRPQGVRLGGPGPIRTADLTLIRGAL
jgi:hypothetical protein